MKRLFLLLALAVAQVLHAQTNPPAPPRIRVRFTCTCDNSLSRMYATRFRDLLATNPRYVEIAERPNDGDY